MKHKMHWGKDNNRQIRTLDLVSMGGVALIALAGVVLMSVATHAESAVVDPITVTLETSCTLSGTVNTPHTAEVLPGTYTEGIGTTTIKALCNDVAGFSLYAVGYTGNSLGSNVLASGVSSTYDIPTGTATSGDSAWAMKVNAVTGVSTPTIVNSFDNYHTVPSSYTKVATYSGATDLTDGSSMTTTYAVNISNAQLSGDYTGKVRYVMVHPSTASGYTVIYNATGGTVSPVSEVVTLGSSTTLPTPTQSGYSFLGWYTAATGGTKIGDAGDSYTPTENTVIYAQWRELMNFDKAFAAAGKTKSGDYYAMLDMTSAICDAVDEGQEGTLVDTRDNNTYNVAKLADGKCWMLDNLAFNGKNNKGSGSYITMDNTNTNINTIKTWNDTVRTGWTSSSQNSYVASYINDASKDVVSSNAKDQAGNWKVGVYYNYCAATLDTICSSSISTEASYDVCPKGWKMPTAGYSTSGTNDYYNLYSRSEYNTYDKYRDALHLPLSGRFYSGSPNYQGSYGVWWSTTAYRNENRYFLGIDTSSIYPVNDDTRRIGYSIRCISSQ